MKESFWRSLSARVILGFVVLILTYTVTTTLTVIYIADVGREISVIRRGYLRLALESKDLDRKQEELRSYLLDDIDNEISPTRISYRLSALRSRRMHILSELRRILDSLGETPIRHDRRLATSRQLIDATEKEINKTIELYTRLEHSPPVAPLGPATSSDLEMARDIERRIIGVKIRELTEYQEHTVTQTAQNLERNERRLRFFTIGLGLGAILLGFLITLWSVFNLRPLRRLREAARNIAAGNYDERVPAVGPSEVRGIAVEFNAMAKALEDRERELIRSERLAAVGKMAATIAHEIRNPLSSISLNAELLADGPDPTKERDWQEACFAIVREAERLTAITEDYLALSRRPSPRLVLENFESILHNSLLLARETIAAAGVELRTRLSAPQALVLADESQLHQVLLNMLRNAVEALATTSPAWIEIETQASDAHVTLTIRDNGPGISDELASRVFDAFVSTKTQGTGLGLSISQQIISDHNGILEYVKQAGGGATFRVTMPRATETARSNSSSY